VGALTSEVKPFTFRVGALTSDFVAVSVLSFNIDALRTECCVPKGSLAGYLGCREMAFELVCGADFSWKLMCGAGPGDLGGCKGVGFCRKSTKNQAEKCPVELPSGIQECLLGSSAAHMFVMRQLFAPTAAAYVTLVAAIRHWVRKDGKA